jgi:hypothetical protein
MTDGFRTVGSTSLCNDTALGYFFKSAAGVWIIYHINSTPVIHSPITVFHSKQTHLSIQPTDTIPIFEIDTCICASHYDLSLGAKKNTRLRSVIYEKLIIVTLHI